MSKPSRRPGREAIKAQRKERKKAQRELRDEQSAEGFDVPSSATISNCKCPWKSVEEETEARGDAVTQQIKIYRQLNLPLGVLTFSDAVGKSRLNLREVILT